MWSFDTCLFFFTFSDGIHAVEGSKNEVHCRNSLLGAPTPPADKSALLFGFDVSCLNFRIPFLCGPQLTLKWLQN